MIDLEMIPALLLVLALTAYALLGGADYGAGIWALLARGPGAERQRAAVHAGMGPVWEANHVWLIFVVVLLFTAFPRAFGSIITTLYVPLLLAAVPIVVRGATFAFRSEAEGGSRMKRALDLAFGLSSVMAPFFLGVALGAAVSGTIRVEDGTPAGGFLEPWLGPFPLVVGALAVAVSAHLAAAYLTLETQGDLRELFRRRALLSAGAVGVLSLAALPLAAIDAPRVWEELSGGRAVPLLVVAPSAMAVSVVAMAARQYQVARAGAIAEVVAVLWGGLLAQYPYLIPPDLTITSAAASSETLQALALVAAIGIVIVVPALGLLFYIFKGESLPHGRRPASSGR